MFIRFFYKIINVVHNSNSSMYDRYYWLKKNLVVLKNDSKLLDIGCGNGWALPLALKIGFYKVIGLSWSKTDIEKNRIRLSDNIEYIVGDARKLDEINFNTKFDAILNIENIEHIINSEKLIKDISSLLNNGGLLYLTTPNLLYKKLYNDSLTKNPPIEDGGHVVRGYSYQRLKKIMSKYNLQIIKVNYVTGKLSSLLINIQRILPFNIFFLKIIFIPLALIFTRLDNFFFANNDLNLSIAIIAEKIDN
jgi:2-polyprenyl-3-methyl-5-hydroxy-6-metoxy-1,4-benzoquinol methylase